MVGPEAPALSSLSADDRMFEVLELRRLSDGVVQGTFRLTNLGEPRLLQQQFDDDTALGYREADLSGLRLLDKASGSAYAPLVDSSRTCLCNPLLARKMATGETALLYAAFPAPPASSTPVDISVPTFPQPMTGVPIS